MWRKGRDIFPAPEKKKNPTGGFHLQKKSSDQNCLFKTKINISYLIYISV